MRRKIFSFPSSFTLSDILSTHFQFPFYFVYRETYLFCLFSFVLFIYLILFRSNKFEYSVKDIPIEVTLKFPKLAT